METQKKLVIGVFILAFVAFILDFIPQMKRFYGVMTLFESQKIVHNFSHMDEIFITESLPSAQRPSGFNYLTPSEPNRLENLPKDFVFAGKAIDMEQFINETHTTSFLILDGKKIIFEDYYQGTKPADKRIIWSISKSFISILLGIARDQNLLPELHEPISKYVTKLKTSGYNKVPIQHILEMSSGIEFSEDYDDYSSDINRFGRVLALGGSIDNFAYNLKSETQSGQRVNYVSLDTHVLGMLLREVTQTPLLEYFKTNLWEPLKTEGTMNFIMDNTGQPMILSGISMRSRDLLRFGQMIANQGRVGSTQVVSSDWVMSSTSWHSKHTMPGDSSSSGAPLGYGYQWWIPENSIQECLGIGLYGQYVYINKRERIVIVKTSTHKYAEADHMQHKLKSITAFRRIVQHLRSPKNM
jgi:CubicO group peptidase (beta-lactamase class C family)